MLTRKAEEKDMVPAGDLARALDLYYPGLESDAVRVAEEAGRIVGLAVLKRHPDCLELCALGVDPAFRGQGIGGRLVGEMAEEARGDLYLGTVIPEYFRRLGFEPAGRTPRAFLVKRASGWCDGCEKEKCVVMIRKG